MKEIIAIVLFILMYIFMIIYSDKREYVALLCALIYMLIGILPVEGIVNHIDFNVLFMMGGTMILVYYFIESRMPVLIADFLLDKSPNVMWVTIFMSAFAGFISAFIDNTATVLMIAPVAMEVCKKLKINPVSMIIALAVSSNLQGAATLVGDTTSIMLGAHAKMDFNSFFFLNGKPSIFFAVELGALASLLTMFFMFRKETSEVEASKDVRVRDYFPTIMLIVLVISLILASFIPNKPDITNGLICMIFSLIVMFVDAGKHKTTNRILEDLKSIDYQTLLLLLGLFLVIAGITNVGVIEDFSKIIVKVGGNNIFLLYTIIVVGSAIFSGFIDNIPYVATMLPVVAGVSTSLGINPYLLYFGLLSGATLGGNLTPIGASANIAAVGLLKKEGYEVSFKDFMKIGVPLTIAALGAGYLFIWFVWR